MALPNYMHYSYLVSPKKYWFSCLIIDEHPYLLCRSGSLPLYAWRVQCLPVRPGAGYEVSGVRETPEEVVERDERKLTLVIKRSRAETEVISACFWRGSI